MEIQYGGRHDNRPLYRIGLDEHDIQTYLSAHEGDCLRAKYKDYYTELEFRVNKAARGFSDFRRILGASGWQADLGADERSLRRILAAEQHKPMNWIGGITVGYAALTSWRPD